MFEVRGDYDLKPHLEDMGMRGLFQAGLADLSGINGKHDLYLNSAKHKTFLKVSLPLSCGVFTTSQLR